MKNSDAEAWTHKLIVLHSAYSHFQIVANYETYRVLNKSQTYNENISAHTCKYSKRMETLVKAYMFDGWDPTTILHSLAQFRRALTCTDSLKVWPCIFCLLL